MKQQSRQFRFNAKNGQPVEGWAGTRAAARGLWVTGFGAEVDAEADAYVIRAAVEEGVKSRPVRVPALRVSRVVVQRGVAVTQAAIRLSLEAAVPLSFIDRCGKLRGHVMPGASLRGDLRMAQYRAWMDPAARLEVARAMVGDKLAESRSLVRHLVSHRPSDEAGMALAAVEQSLTRLGRAVTVDELMGLEGAAGRAGFAALRASLRRLDLPCRRRQPAPDPVNALLSYAYAVLARDVAARIELAHLDPWLGFLHRPENGRASLALDLMEPLRPAIAERLVLALINGGRLREEHFEPIPDPVPGADAGPGVFLNPEGRRIFFEEYEQRTHPRRPDGGGEAWPFESAHVCTGVVNAFITRLGPWL